MIYITKTGYTPAYRVVTSVGGTTVTAPPAFVYPLDTKLTSVSSNFAGYASSNNGSVKIYFTQGSVLPGQTLSVNLTSVPRVAAPFNAPAGSQFVSYIIYAKPLEATLESTVRLSVPNITGLSSITSQDSIPFYKFDVNAFTWEAVVGVGTWEPSTNTIDIYVQQLGWLAAILPITPPPGSIEGVVRSSGTPLSGVSIWTDASSAISDTNGQYDLYYVPTGLTTVDAALPGYNFFSIMTTVTSEQRAHLDINMIQASGLNSLSGRVMDKKNGALWIPNALVHEDTDNLSTYSDSNGNYSIPNIPTTGSVTFTVSALNYHTSSEVVRINSGANSHTFWLNSNTGSTAESFMFDFEGNGSGSLDGFLALPPSRPGTLGGNLWHLQDANAAIIDSFNSSQDGGVVVQTRKVNLPMFSNGTTDEAIPPDHLASVGHHWYCWFGMAANGQTDITGETTGQGSYIGYQAASDILSPESFTGGLSVANVTGGSSLNDQCTLESPVLDLSDYVNATLTFWTWWEVEGKNPSHQFDLMAIYASRSTDNNYSNWTLLGYLNPYSDPIPSPGAVAESYTTGGYDQPAIWVQQKVDMTNFAGCKIKIRFVFQMGDNKYNGYRGWIIDDVGVTNEAVSVSSYRPPLKKSYIPLKR